MSGVGSSELIILILIGLIVLGPKRLPQIANQIGGWIGQARRMTRAMRRQLEEELNFDDNSNIKQTAIAPPSVLSSTADPADPDYDIEEPAPEPEARVPHDDDTYSPLHDDDGDDTTNEDDVGDEKRA
ncbi:MAG: Sec-independent protein translocase protein TatB [Gammaproteobacteria bacterium]|nr:Sec-independent protein translocase protein TatB [Gammaproteobacteria bacterium]MDH3374554.1 Sec-independent protein translocase protein TatB [Gammaproteobacteria bacterium]MDH3408561.1 Sec-independent protein translocase protein TatB [Gammaproteobacteria bacterium]MDH3553443.1 Sec-independent protein translocase protein TatB [Gammaproteobacteria bacterium]